MSEAQELTEIKNVPLPRRGGSEDSSARTALQNSSMAAHARFRSARTHFSQVQKAGFFLVWLSQVFYFLFPRVHVQLTTQVGCPLPQLRRFLVRNDCVCRVEYVFPVTARGAFGHPQCPKLGGCTAGPEFVFSRMHAQINCPCVQPPVGRWRERPTFWYPRRPPAGHVRRRKKGNCLYSFRGKSYNSLNEFGESQTFCPAKVDRAKKERKRNHTHKRYKKLPLTDPPIRQ
jgi:hypothetical protein